MNNTALKYGVSNALNGYRDDRVLIDYLNRYVDRSLDEIASIIGMSRATLYRRLNLLRRNGLSRRYGVKTWCLDYGVLLWFLIPLDISVDPGILMTNNVLRSTIYSINITYAPSRLVVVKHFYKGDKERNLINNVYLKELTDYFEPLESIYTTYILLPRHYYGEKRIYLNTGVLCCPEQDFDHIDRIIVDGLMREIDKPLEISEKYRLPISTIRYHLREHVKKLIYMQSYVIRRKPNIILELIVSNIDHLIKALNVLYTNGSIDYIEGIYIINIGKPVISYIEAHGIYDSVLYDIEALYSIGLVDNMKMYVIYSRSL